VSLDCVIYSAFYSIFFRGAVSSGHGVVYFRDIRTANVRQNNVRVYCAYTLSEKITVAPCCCHLAVDKMPKNVAGSHRLSFQHEESEI